MSFQIQKKSPPPPGVELGGSKDWHVRSIVLSGNGKLHLFKGPTLPKIRITWKKVLSKSVLELNSFEAPSSTLCGDRHMRLRTFLDEIQFQTTFILSFFSGDAYFWQCS